MNNTNHESHSEEEQMRLIGSYTIKEWKPLLDMIQEIEQADKFEYDPDPEFEAKLKKGIIDLSYNIETELVARFRELVYDLSIIVHFDWSKWDEGRAMAGNENFDYDRVDIPTKCKLITAIVRHDHFSDGALAAAFTSGLILKILKSIEKQLG